jgi:two-component system cell cycle response regulator
MYILEVVSGPMDGKTWPFDREITIGRDDAVAGACLKLDRYTSRRHAQLRAEGEGLVLMDLASRNGTKVGGQAVSTETPIRVGDRFLIGRTVLRVRRAEPEA